MVNVKEKLSEGYFLARVVIELLGKPKKHVEDTLELVLSEFKKQEDTFVVKEDIFEATEQDGGMFSTFVELEFLVKELKQLTYISFAFMPSSIEVIEPEEFVAKNQNLSHLYNDLLAQLHKVDMLVKNKAAENEHLKVTMGTLLRQVVVALLETPQDAAKIAKKLHIPDDQAQKILDTLLKENLIQKKGKGYARKQLK